MSIVLIKVLSLSVKIFNLGMRAAGGGNAGWNNHYLDKRERALNEEFGDKVIVHQRDMGGRDACGTWWPNIVKVVEYKGPPIRTFLGNAYKSVYFHSGNWEGAWRDLKLSGYKNIDDAFHNRHPERFPMGDAIHWDFKRVN